MKLNKIFAAFMLIAAVAFTACNEKNPPVGPQGPGNGQDTTQNGDTTQIVDPIAPDTAGWNIPAGALTVAQAREKCAALESDATTGEKFYVMGWVKKIHSKHADGVANFGNALFYMEDVKNANSQDDFIAYQVYGPNGEKITNPDAVAVGDFVVVYGELTNYSGTFETVGKGAAYIWKSTNPLLTGSGNPGNNTEITYEEGELSVAKALALAPASGDTTDVIKVRGLVKSVKSVNLSNGNAQFYLTDDGINELYCYNLSGVNGEKFVSGEQLKEGDIVTVEARLYNYPSSNGDLLELIKGNLTRTTNTFDPSQAEGPEEVTVAEAFAKGSLLGQGETSAGQYKVSGIVTEVTDASTSYGNLTFKIKDENGTQEMICYRLYYLDNKKYSEADLALETGDIVTIVAQIKNHYGTVEFVSGYLTEHIK